MPVFGGFESQVYVSFAGPTGPWNRMPKMRDCSLEMNSDEIDASNHDTAGWKEKLNGLKEWSASGEYLLIDAGSTVQDQIEQAYLDNTTIDMLFVPKVGAGLRGYTGAAVVGTVSQKGPTSDPYTVSFELRSRGALSKVTQTGVYVVS